MISRDQVLADNVAHLVALIQGELIDSPHRTPHSFIEWLWLNNSGACEIMLIDSIPEWKTFGDEIVRAIWLAADHLNDDEFLQAVFNCSASRGIPRSHKSRLLALLVDKEFPQARAKYEKHFKSKVRSIQRGETECSVDNVMPDVQEACRFQINTLLPELRKLEEMCKPLVVSGQLWPYALHAVQAAIIMHKEGGGGLRRIAADESVDPSMREQAVYCIACLREGNDVGLFKEIYWQRFHNSVFRLQFQAVDGIVYLASPDQVSAFLVEAIDERLTYGKGLFRNADRYLNMFAEAAFYAAQRTPDLIERLLRLVEAKNISFVAAPAWVALEQIGYDSGGQVPSRLHSEISVARHLIEELVSSDELKSHIRPRAY